MKTKYWHWIILFLIFLFGLFLRTYKLGELPASMHRDELAIAYNAYSIIRTGKDEWGIKHPLVFKSFDDYKLPAMVYGTIPGLQIFGLTPLGARFPAALYSAVAIITIYLLSSELTKSRRFGLLSAFLLSISFWHLRESRNIYEPVIIVSVSLLSYWALYKGRKNPAWLFAAIGFFAFANLIYSTSLFIFPFLLIAWMSFQWLTTKKLGKKIWILGLVTTVLVVSGTMFAISGVTSGKSQTTIFFSQEIADQRSTRLNRLWTSGIPLTKLVVLWEHGFDISYNFAQSYVKSLDMTYLFFKGGNNDWHNFRTLDFGDMNPVLLPFFLIGVWFVLKNPKKSAHAFMLLLLLISPIPSALTVDAPNTNRLMDLHVAVLLIASYGFWQSWRYASSKKIRWVLLLAAGAYLLVTAELMNRYFLTYNKLLSSSWNPEVPALMTKIDYLEGNYDQVIFAQPIAGAYIYYAFYTGLEPDLVQDAPRHTSSTFNPVVSLKNLQFEGQVASTSAKVLVVSAKQRDQAEPVFTILNWEGQPVWWGYTETILAGSR